MTESDSALMIVRKVAASDLPTLLELYTHLHPDDEPLPLAGAEPIWKSLQNDTSQLFCGAYLDNTLAAVCTLIVVPNLTRGGQPYALIENVVTHPDYRRRGYGNAVLTYALASAWERDCYKVMLLTGSKNEATLRFYENAGFRRGVKTGFEARPGGS